jgi:ATP-dependent Lhr-like helicase
MWGGRWSLVQNPGSSGPEVDESELAESVARQWLARYGVVSRDWWRRERPAVGWREIYHELKRLEFRGEVQRGYFVSGLAGAQFALPDAVEMLRAPVPDSPSQPVVIATSDPANVYSLTLQGVDVDPMTRPRGTGALLVTVDGVVVVSTEGRGRRITIRVDAEPETIRVAIATLVAHLTAVRGASGRKPDVVTETINGEPAGTSEGAGVLLDAWFRREGLALRYYASIS